VDEHVDVEGAADSDAVAIEGVDADGGAAAGRGADDLDPRFPGRGELLRQELLVGRRERV